jgi:hypothetical protein
MAAQRTRTPRKIVKIPSEYLDAVQLSHLLFPALYQFENGLRLVIHYHLSVCYGPDWWRLSLQTQMPDIFKYEEKQRTKMAAMPWIGASSRVSVLPVHLVTLGHLEEIIKKYRSDCIPELFPTLDFFTGHMETIKRVRNLYSHMFPCITQSDTAVARREIRTLAEHLNCKLPQLLPAP